MNIKLLIEYYLEFLSLKGGCRGSSESTLVKMPHCLKSHVPAHIILIHLSTKYAIVISPSSIIFCHYRAVIILTEMLYPSILFC